jgi:hypothetical protein
MGTGAPNFFMEDVLKIASWERTMTFRGIAILTGLALAAGCVGQFGAASAAPLGQPMAAFSAVPTAPIETVQYLPRSGFPNPHMRGAVVDWCSTWSNNCGPGGATLFCRAHGFGQAISWDVYEARHTYVIGSGRYCDADFCKGYSFIRCG